MAGIRVEMIKHFRLGLKSLTKEQVLWKLMGYCECFRFSNIIKVKRAGQECLKISLDPASRDGSGRKGKVTSPGEV